MTKEAVGSRVRLDPAQNEEDSSPLQDSLLETEDPGPTCKPLTWAAYRDSETVLAVPRIAVSRDESRIELNRNKVGALAFVIRLGTKPPPVPRRGKPGPLLI